MGARNLNEPEVTAMAFLSRNRGLALKTFLYQLVMSFFGTMMFTATSRNQALLVIGQVMVIAFSLYIFFYQSMQAGSKECEFGIGHGVKTCAWAGILPVFLGFVPMILLSVWGALVPPVNADGGASSSYVPYVINNLLQQGVYQGIYSMAYPIAEGDLGQATNARALLFPFAFLPGFMAGSAGFAFGWFRFRKDGKKS